jgi:hypothetical protein
LSKAFDGVWILDFTHVQSSTTEVTRLPPLGETEEVQQLDNSAAGIAKLRGSRVM